jgi:O-acetyl-ADP-ribose deacetylase (regulator of RNase III)
MIEYITKDITTVTHGVVAHGCNVQGKFGAGVAKSIRTKWPEVYDSYIQKCSINPTHPALLLGQCDIVQLGGDMYVANLFTQLNYGREKKAYASPDAIYEAVQTCMQFCLDSQVIWEDFLPLYMPRIGCGLGGLDWDKDVGPAVEHLAEQLNVQLYVCDL